MVTDPQSAPFSVAIIGGGLAGLTLSIGLTRFGISHKIYESAKCFSEIGAGIAMGPNAVWALALIDPQLRQCYDRCATYNDREDQRELCFDYIYGMESDKSGATKYAAF
jgi:salicylate hydroxylase